MQEIKIDDEFRALIPPLTADERAQLEENLTHDGCRDPLVVWKGLLVDGHNRFEICQRLRIEFKTAELTEVSSRELVQVWIIKNQFGRRNLQPFQRGELALKLEPLVAARAKENQSGGQGGILLKQKSAEANPINTRSEIAKAAGVSHDTIHKTKVIIEKADEETKQKLRTGQTSINAVYTDISRKQKEEKREQRRDENRAKVEATSDPVKAGVKFATIVTDPPWDWSDEGDQDQLGRARPTYATMSFERLLKLPVQTMADDDCHIYLWITNRSLPKGFALLEAWGFRYVTCLTWCKPSIGMGNYFRGSTEQVLFGVKGSQPLKRKDVGTWFAADRGPLGHSSKPTSFYDLVESCSPGPFLEMFARSPRANWQSWGAEA